MLDAIAGHQKGLGGAAYIPETDEVVTCGEDGRVCIRHADALEKELREIPRLEACPVHCVASNPKRGQFAVGDKQKGVYIYEHPEGQAVLGARLQLPVLLLSYNGTGEKLAAAGDDELIHLINIRWNDDTDSLKAQVLRKLKAVPHTRGLACDPLGEFIAAVSAAGQLQIWSAIDGKQLLSRKKAAPDVSGKQGARSAIAWHPEGTDLAVPGPDSDVVFYERHNWESSQELHGEHSGPVSVLAFSPNGLYLATAGQDCKLVVWDVRAKKAVATQECPEQLVSLEWQPGGNRLLAMTEEGRLVEWKNAIPDSLPGPCEQVSSPQGLASRSRLSTPADSYGGEGGDDAGTGDDGYEDDGGGDGFDDIIKAAREDAGAFASSPSRPLVRSRPGTTALRWPPLQQPFQSGATPAGDADRRWLAYNLIGGISIKEEDGVSIIDVSFHDLVAHRHRVPPYRDYQSLDLAALGEEGAFYARSSGDEAGPPRLMWRPFQPALQNSDWSLALPPEERVACIAAGRGFLAAATSSHLLRLFSVSGLQTALLTLEGAPVTVAAQGDLLAVVWHSGPPAVPGSHSLAFAVYDARRRQMLQQGSMPLSAGASLRWLGFSEDGQLCSYDSKGVLRQRGQDFGGCWLQLLDEEEHRQDGESYWPVSMSASELHCIVCPSGGVPPVHPRPVHHRLPLQPPVLGADSSVAVLEGTWMRVNLRLSNLAAQMADEASIEELEEESICCQTDADRALLRLYQDALKTGRYQRAHELAACMHLERSLEGALKLTNLHKVAPLAERISRLLVARQEAAAAEEFEDPEPTPMPQTMRATSADPISPPQSAQAPTTTQVSADDDFADLEVVEPKAASKATAAGGSGSANPFARGSAQPLKPRNAIFGDDKPDKRKATEGANPFSRKPKLARQ